MQLSTFRFGAQETFTFRVRQELEQPALTRQHEIIEQNVRISFLQCEEATKGSEIISTVISQL